MTEELPKSMPEIPPQRMGVVLPALMKIIISLDNYSLPELTEQDKADLVEVGDEDENIVIIELNSILKSLLNSATPEEKIEYLIKIQDHLVFYLKRGERIMEREQQNAKAAEATGSNPPLSFPRE